MRNSDNLEGVSLEDIDTVTIKESCPECGSNPLVGERVGRRLLIVCLECEYREGIDIFNELEEKYDEFIVYEPGEENPQI